MKTLYGISATLKQSHDNLNFDYCYQRKEFTDGSTENKYFTSDKNEAEAVRDKLIACGQIDREFNGQSVELHIDEFEVE